METARRASGCMFGLAYGDAFGAPTEFRTVAQIVERYGPAGPRDLTGDPARVTDDTQMTLAVAEALLAASVTGEERTADRLEPRLRSGFLAWWTSPDNDRAPGQTCLSACRALSTGMPWPRATQRWSKGCGANMRVAPVGLVPGLAADDLAGTAQLQAALTHGHPTALAASELTAWAVRWLRDGIRPADLPGALRRHCREARRTYHEAWLGELWRNPGVATPEDFIARGWDECDRALVRVEQALRDPRPDADPCLATGAGWVAEEALATALHCFLLHPGDPVGAISRAAVTSGDSDSIACLAGAFAGAACGLAAWPSAWAGRIEYRDRLARLGETWDTP